MAKLMKRDGPLKGQKFDCIQDMLIAEEEAWAKCKHSGPVDVKRGKTPRGPFMGVVCTQCGKILASDYQFSLEGARLNLQRELDNLTYWTTGRGTDHGKWTCRRERERVKVDLKIWKDRVDAIEARRKKVSAEIHETPSDHEQFVVASKDLHERKPHTYYVDSYDTREEANADVRRRRKYGSAWWRNAYVIDSESEEQ